MSPSGKISSVVEPGLDRTSGRFFSEQLLQCFSAFFPFHHIRHCLKTVYNRTEFKFFPVLPMRNSFFCVQRLRFTKRNLQKCSLSFLMRDLQRSRGMLSALCFCLSILSTCFLSIKFIKKRNRIKRRFKLLQRKSIFDSVAVKASSLSLHSVSASFGLENLILVRTFHRLRYHRPVELPTTCWLISVTTPTSLVLAGNIALPVMVVVSVDEVVVVVVVDYEYGFQ